MTEDSSLCTRRLSSLACLTSVCSDCLCCSCSFLRRRCKFEMDIFVRYLNLQYMATSKQTYIPTRLAMQPASVGRAWSMNARVCVFGQGTTCSKWTCFLYHVRVLQGINKLTKSQSRCYTKGTITKGTLIELPKTSEMLWNSYYTAGCAA